MEHHILSYTVDGILYKTESQYLTGIEIKTIAGIPADTDLYLAIRRPFSDELIENDTRVNLARPDVEQFFVKKKLSYSINGVEFVSYKQFISGEELRIIGGIPSNHELFLDIDDNWQDDYIDMDELVDLARPGKEKFISRPIRVEIIVNARKKVWEANSISYSQVVELAFGSINLESCAYTITYYSGGVANPEGILVNGASVMVVNNMIFDVTATDKS